MIQTTSNKTIEEIAHFLAIELEIAVAMNGHIHIALSGGNTPKALFQIWSKSYSQKKFWHSISYFWVDERCVEPISEESNYWVANTLFFEPLEIKANNIHRIYGENTPENEALRYSELLSKKIPLSYGFPQFDFVFLGVGDDGHTASIFPGFESLFDSTHFCSTAINPYTNQQRITLTGKTINNAKRVMFIVTGNSKKEILEYISLENNVKKYPAQYVAPTNNKLEIITDIKL